MKVSTQFCSAEAWHFDFKENVRYPLSQEDEECMACTEQVAPDSAKCLYSLVYEVLDHDAQDVWTVSSKFAYALEKLRKSLSVVLLNNLI